MLLWVAFAGLTALVLIVLLIPLRKGVRMGREDRAAYDQEIFRDQLAELDRDERAGLIGQAEATAARNEISRRLLAAQAESADTKDDAPPVPAWMAVATIATVPAIALATYLYSGRPDLPAQPLAERIAGAVENQDMAAMIRQVERHLEKEPKDLRGWLVLAPSYRRMGRFADAANAYRRALLINGPDAELLTDLGEAMVLDNQGIVSQEASKVFSQALTVDSGFMKARFYSALALQQEGKTAGALEIWRGMLANAPADAPWREAVSRQIEAAGGALPKGPVLSREQIEQGEQMSQGDRTAMIRSMVDGLDQRLSEDGSDLDGWLRLIRARMVLGEKDKAIEAIDRASAALKDNKEAAAKIDEARKALGL